MIPIISDVISNTTQICKATWEIILIFSQQNPVFQYDFMYSVHYNMQSTLYLSLFMRKPAFCIMRNKDADQLRGNREADQRFCFRYKDSTIPLLPKFEISSLLPSSVSIQPGLCRTRSETPKMGFLITRLICSSTMPDIQTTKSA